MGLTPCQKVGHPFLPWRPASAHGLPRFWRFTSSIGYSAGSSLRAISVEVPSFTPIISLRAISSPAPDSLAQSLGPTPTSATTSATGYVCAGCPFTFQPILRVPSLANLLEPTLRTSTQARLAPDTCLSLVGEVEGNGCLGRRIHLGFLAYEMAPSHMAESSASNDDPTGSVVEHDVRFCSPHV